jgi:glycosyltransferase involved in cell wall biosynthesis
MSKQVREPAFSVIIPLWNGAAYIGKCLDALRGQSFPADAFEVIVVDNGSIDEGPEIARRYDFVRWEQELSPGSYSARNAGLAVARGRYIAFTDADCVPDPDWLASAHVALERAGNADVVLAGAIRLFREQPDDSRLCELYETLFAFNQADYAAKGYCATANWVSRAQPLRDLGGFDASRKSGGDFDMATRLRACGFTVRYVPDMVIAHPTRGRFRDLLRKRRRVAGGHWKDSTGGKARVKLIAAVPLRIAQMSGAVLAERHLAMRDRIGLVGVVTVLMACSLVEYLRLMLGGTPRRA